MSVSTIYAPYKQPGNGVTLAFTVPWKILLATDAVVQKIDVAGNVSAPLTINVDYTITGIDPVGETFLLTYTVAPVNLGYAYVTRASNEQQGTVWPRDGNMPAKAGEVAFDKLTLIVQELVAWLGRTISYPAWFSNPPPLSITVAPADRRALVYSSNGAGGFNIIPSTNDPDLQATQAAASAAAAAASAAAAAGSATAAAASATAAAASAAAAAVTAYASGTYAAKPAAPVTRLLYYSTDRGSLELYIPDAGRWYLLG